MGDNETKLLAVQKAQKQRTELRIAEESKARLQTLSNKKFKTCFVFAIAEFEKVFGLELWGHGLPENELTSQQKANRDRWQHVRTNILNKGHTQARGMDAELELHDIKFIGYKMDLIGRDGQ